MTARTSRPEGATAISESLSLRAGEHVAEDSSPLATAFENERSAFGRRARFAMAVDTRRCVGCNACVLACKAENAVPDGFCRDWIVEEVRGELPHLTAEIRSERCNQCSRPPCVSVCPTGASHVAHGGVVLVTHDKCTGCKACMGACPYDARFIHPDGYADKCTFCLHRVEKGLQPACVSVCPTRALTFGDRNDPRSAVSQLLASRKWKVKHPETGAEPNVFFLV